MPGPGLCGGLPKRRLGVLGHVLGHGVAVQHQRRGAGPSRGGVLEREAERAEGFGRRARLPDLLRDGVQNLWDVDAAVVAAGLLVGRERRVLAALGRLGDDNHRRGAEPGLHLAERADAPDPGALAGEYARVASEAAVDLRHHAGLALVARADDVDIVVGECLEDLDHAAAREPEDEISVQVVERRRDAVRSRGHWSPARRPVVVRDSFISRPTAKVAFVLGVVRRHYRSLQARTPG